MMMLLCDVLRIKNKEVRAKDKRIIATVAPVARTNNIMRGVIAGRRMRWHHDHRNRDIGQHALDTRLKSHDLPVILILCDIVPLRTYKLS